MGRTARTHLKEFTGPKPSELLREIENKKREAALNTDEGRLKQALECLLGIRRGFQKLQKIYYSFQPDDFKKLSPEDQREIRNFGERLSEELMIIERGIASAKDALEKLKAPPLGHWQYRAAVKKKVGPSKEQTRAELAKHADEIAARLALCRV